MKRFIASLLLAMLLVFPQFADAKPKGGFAYKIAGTETSGDLANIDCSNKDGLGTDLEDGDIYVVGVQGTNGAEGEVSVWIFIDDVDDSNCTATGVPWRCCSGSGTGSCEDGEGDTAYMIFPKNQANCPTANQGAFIKTRVLAMEPWYSLAISASGFIADGTICEAPAAHQINSGPNMYTVTCDGATDGQFEVTVPMPENWDGGNVYVKIHALKSVASPTGTVEFDVKVQARGGGDAFNTTWTSAVAADFDGTWTQYAPDFATSAVIACGGGTADEVLAIHLNRDADIDGSTQDVEILGITVFYQIDDMDDRD